MRPEHLTLRIPALRSFAFAALLPALGVAVQACSSSGPPTECIGETGGQALSVCSTGATVKGVDVSVYQGTVNWTSVKNAGNAYAFVRVSDGINSIDSKFAANWPAVKSVGMIRGAYQFFRPGQDPTTQANVFVNHLNAAGGLAKGDLPAVLDLETADGQSNSTVVAHALTWLSVVEQKTGIKPIVYTAAFMSSVIGNNFGKYPLWVANYGPKCPTMPSGWSAWQFWQNSSTGSVGGISGNVDTDIFNGPLAALEQLTLQAAPSGGGTIHGEGTGGTAPQSSPSSGSNLNEQGSAMGTGGNETYSAPLPSDTSTPDPTPSSDPCAH
jgi:lysozyme